MNEEEKMCSTLLITYNINFNTNQDIHKEKAYVGEGGKNGLVVDEVIIWGALSQS